MRTFKAAAVYFLLVFAVGWVLGPIRELWAVPRFGRVTGVLLEGPIMLIAMIISARWLIRRFDVLRTLRTTISMGLPSWLLPKSQACFGYGGYPSRNISGAW